MAKNELAVVKAADFLALSRPSEETAEIINANMGGSQASVFSLDRLKIPAGGGTTWAIPTMEGEVPAQEVVGIIALWQDVRVFWKSSFSGAGGPPDCISNDCRTGIGKPGGACATCPMAQFGSAAQVQGKPENAKGQACKQCRRLFILLPGDILPLLLSLPPTSLKAVNQYFQRLASKGIAYYAVMTKFTLNRTKNAGGTAYSEVVLTVAGYLSPQETAAVKALHDQFAPVLLAISPGSGDYGTISPVAAETDLDGPESEAENGYIDGPAAAGEDSFPTAAEEG